MNRAWLAAGFLPAAILCAAPVRVAVVREGELGAPARHGLSKLEAALRAQGVELADAPGPAGHVVVARVRPGGGAESLTVGKGRYRGKPALFLTGGDARGLMYAALDAAERVGAGDPFQQVREVTEQPYLAERAVSMYTMQRAWFESRLYDERHWQRYFDLLAASRINSFVVIFGYENGGFMAPLYPYFFNVAGFAGVEMVGLTAERQARNTAAFKTMMRLAHERGIEVTAGIWDHIYRGGVQGGGIPGASENAGKRVPGLVWGVTAENLAAYTKAALKRFLEVFPELDAIQFRMHDESGLKPAEMAGFWHEVFALIRQARPALRVDLRAKGLPDAVIADALGQGLQARVSTKYWMEQLGLPFHPTHVNRQNQRERRHGYADLLRYRQSYRVHWQLWSGGTARALLWGDPDYVRRFAASARLYGGQSFEVNEMLATKMLGEAHDARPVEILAPRYRYYDYEFERYWHFYRLWGRVSYNPRTPAEVWSREFERRFGAPAGAHLRDALHLASKVLPRIVAAAYRYNYFPTTRGWAEMNHQDDLAKFATAEGSDTQQFLNMQDEAKSLLAGTDTPLRRPQETALWFARTAGGIDAHVDEAQRTIGAHAGNEFTSTVTDLKILAGLARYYAARLPAGVAYNLYKATGDLHAFDEAVAGEKRASEAWRGIVAAAADVYSQSLPFGAHNVGFRRHWREELGLVERDLAALLSERAKLPAATGPRQAPGVARDLPSRPVVQLLPPPPAQPGRDLEVSAKVTTPAGVKWVRLRYRHLTQYEDYETAEMTLDAQSGLYRTRIPAAFIDPQWDLMYFVEVVDRKGAGGMYPDLETETPYVVVAVKR